MNTVTTLHKPAEQQAIQTEAPQLRERLVSLDVFRGTTILLMILVNNPGTWSAVYPPLLHASWHGWTPTDLVFPFFLFIVGVAIVLAYQKRLDRGDLPGVLLKKTIRRSAILFGLGLFLAAFPIISFSGGFGLRPELVNLRIMGVLQRIALCYLAASIIFLYARPRTQVVWMWSLVVFYWLAMTFIPVPGYGTGMLDRPESTLTGYIDQLLLNGHMWASTNNTYDPEGLFSTLPAISTTLFGVWIGRLLLEDTDRGSKVARLFVRGVILVVLGYIWNWFMPINKSIWTSSYAVFTAGQAICALAVCFWFIDVKGYKKWTLPLVVYGVNAITVYVLSGMLGDLLYVVKIPVPGGDDVSLQAYIFERVFLPIASPINASLLYALTWVTGFYLVLLWMYKKRIFLKI